MKKFALLLIAGLMFLHSSPAVAGQHVEGYYRHNGTYVQPYYRSSPDNTVTNNYSYRGNVNPYTGNTGTNSYSHDLTSPYFNGADNHGEIGHDNDGNDGNEFDPN